MVMRDVVASATFTLTILFGVVVAAPLQHLILLKADEKINLEDMAIIEWQSSVQNISCQEWISRKLAQNSITLSELARGLLIYLFQEILYNVHLTELIRQNSKKLSSEFYQFCIERRKQKLGTSSLHNSKMFI